MRSSAIATIMILTLAAGAARAAGDLNRAQACVASRNLICAERELTGYLAEYPNDSRSTALLAIVLTMGGKHKQALPWYRRAVGQGVATYDFFGQYAVSLEAVGDTAESMKWNRRALAIVPGLVDARAMLAQQLVKVGQPQQALAVLASGDAYFVKQGGKPYFTAQRALIAEQMKRK